MSDIFDVDEFLEHHGIKGMHWGSRKGAAPGVSSATNKIAKSAAEEHVKAKLAIGEGAGNRRKLIKAKVAGLATKDPDFQKAFDHHVARQDLEKLSSKAVSERRRKDVSKGVGKTVRGTRHVLNGNPQYASATVAIGVGGALYAHRTGIDKTILNAGKTLLKNMSAADNKGSGVTVADILKNLGG